MAAFSFIVLCIHLDTAKLSLLSDWIATIASA
jgi:hypothetical protein